MKTSNSFSTKSQTKNWTIPLYRDPESELLVYPLSTDHAPFSFDHFDWFMTNKKGSDPLSSPKDIAFIEEYIAKYLTNYRNTTALVHTCPGISFDGYTTIKYQIDAGHWEMNLDASSERVNIEFCPFCGQHLSSTELTSKEWAEEIVELLNRHELFRRSDVRYALNKHGKDPDFVELGVFTLLLGADLFTFTYDMYDLKWELSHN